MKDVQYVQNLYRRCTELYLYPKADFVCSLTSLQTKSAFGCIITAKTEQEFSYPLPCSHEFNDKAMAASVFAAH